MRQVLILSFLFILASCASHRENIMFEVSEEHQNNLGSDIWKSDKQFTIQPYDVLDIIVVNKSGEILIDPEFQSSGSGSAEAKSDISYRVDVDGYVSMPMVGKVLLRDKSISEAEESVKAVFISKYYEPFVKIEFLNKRVFVLGASGGKVIPLTNEQVYLTEVIALAGGIEMNGKATNIRLMREKEVIVADYSTIEGYAAANILVQPNDIIYIEPVRRPFVETLREYNSLIGFVTGIASVAALIISTRK